MQSVELGAVADADQTQRPIDLFLIFAGANIVATTLQIGASVTGFSWPVAMMVIAAGTLGGAWLVAAVSPVGSRLRVPSIVALRAALGFQGAQLVALLLFVTNFAWIAVNNVIAASIVARLISGPSADYQAAWAVAIGLIATATVLGGPRAVGLADRFAVPAMFLAGIAMTVACLRVDWPAPSSVSTTALGVLRGFDWPFGYQTTWLLMFADYSRYSPPGRRSAWAVFAGLGITALWFMPLGLIASVVAGSSDPGTMVFALGLGWWGGLLIVLGTLTTNFVNIYMSALALKSLRPTTGDRTAVWLIGGIGAALSVMNSVWIDQFANFIGVLAGIFVPIGGLLIAHFLILKRTHAAADLYPTAAGAAPRVGLWSPAGMAAWTIGAAVFYLARPIGGTLPSLVISIAIYLIAARTPRPDSQ
jgi:NCS1 family nucleobase:cation symporter-1